MNEQKGMCMHAERRTLTQILESSQHELYKHGTLTLTALSTQSCFGFFFLFKFMSVVN